MKTLYAAVLGLGLAAYAASPAAENQAVAQTQIPAALGQSQGQSERYLCDERNSVVGELTQNFHEKPVAQGLQGNGTLLEVFASKDTGSWTILITLPNGMSCLTLVGDNWELMPQMAEGPRV